MLNCVQKNFFILKNFYKSNMYCVLYIIKSFVVVLMVLLIDLFQEKLIVILIRFILSKESYKDEESISFVLVKLFSLDDVNISDRKQKLGVFSVVLVKLLYELKFYLDDKIKKIK